MGSFNISRHTFKFGPHIWCCDVVSKPRGFSDGKRSGHQSCALAWCARKHSDLYGNFSAQGPLQCIVQSGTQTQTILSTAIISGSLIGSCDLWSAKLKTIGVLLHFQSHQWGRIAKNQHFCSACLSGFSVQVVRCWFPETSILHFRPQAMSRIADSNCEIVAVVLSFLQRLQSLMWNRPLDEVFLVG